VTRKDGGDARLGHRHAELSQLADDAQISPSGILPGQAANELGPVRPVKTRTGGLAAQHCELVTEHQDLSILCDVVHPVDAHESECAVSQAVEEGKDHGELASPSELLLVKLAAGSSWTLQLRLSSDTPSFSV
jgi:hypothetical protein